MQYFSRWSWLKWWGVIFCAGSVARLWQLGAAPLGYDEHLEYMMALQPLGRMIAATAADVHPPAHHLLIWPIAQLVGVEGLYAAPHFTATLIRLPSALLSMLALYLLRRVGEGLRLSPRAILIGSALAAFLPFQIYYAQESRMYALLLVAGLWGGLSILHRRWWQLLAALVLMEYTQNYGLVYLVVLGAWAVAREFADGSPFYPDISPHYGRIVATFTTAGVAYAPWALTLMAQMSEQKSLWWKTTTTPGELLYTVYSLFWNDTLNNVTSVVAALVTFGVLLVTLWMVLARRAGGAPLWWLVAAPPALAIAAEWVYRPILLPRALIVSAALLYLLIGAAFDALKTWERRVIVLAALPLIFIGAAGTTGVKVTRNTTYSAANVWATIRAQWRAGDVILHGNIASYVDAHGALPPTYPQLLMPVVPGSYGVPGVDVRRAVGIDEFPIGRWAYWRRVWLVWNGSPTIVAAEDAAVMALIAQYPHEQIKREIGPLQNAGVWLLLRQEACQ